MWERAHVDENVSADEFAKAGSSVLGFYRLQSGNPKARTGHMSQTPYQGNESKKRRVSVETRAVHVLLLHS